MRLSIFRTWSTTMRIIAAILLGLLFVPFRSLHAQEQTTTPGAEVISGSECATPARPITFLGDLLATPVPDESYDAPLAIPDGSAVDAATAVEVIAAVRQVIACSNSGEVLRALALFGDDYLRRLFDSSGEIDIDTANKLIETLATPVTIEPEQLVTFLGIREMIAMRDGRVAVVIETDGGEENPEGADVDLFIFKRAAGHWLVDDAVNDIDDIEAIGTAVAGS